MSFTYQQSVCKYNKEAIPGDRANNQDVIYTPENLVSKPDLGTAVAVKVGNFAWRVSGHPEQVVGAGASAPVGFVERVQNYQYYDIDSEGTLVVPDGTPVEIAVKGDFFVKADASVSAGDTVYANNTTGAATASSSGATDSGFKYWNAAASGDMVIITKR